MKKYYLAALCGLVALAFAACEPQNAPEPIPESFPKKHLIEEFTGQTCGYCPYGMDCIDQFIGNDSNWVLVLHHYGYEKDNYTVSGCQTITNKLGVSGAPNASINRATTNYNVGGASKGSVVLHPAYLPITDKTQFATTTYASIVLDNQYDASSRTLKVHVSGAIAKEDYPASLKLTVLVKESGMIGTQADYYNTYQGWKEFRHCNAVRGYLTSSTGDTLSIDATRHYSSDLSITIDEKWVAENCMVVAYITEDFKPVVQVEEAPVVAGSRGGADQKHGGITRVPVADYYPEPNATDGPSTYSGNKAEVLSIAMAQYTPYSSDGFNYWQIQAYDASTQVTINKIACVPFAAINLFTELSQDTIPWGTYEINSSYQPGTAEAGIRDDEQFYCGGSEFYFAQYNYLTQGYLVPEAEWLIADGTLTIAKDGWSLKGHARNGASILLQGSSAIKNYGQSSAPARRKAQRLGGATRLAEQCIETLQGKESLPILR
ncbi:MAG: Omp28-related outer membrane protein [Paludibacteraceae bacterium]|nr:Omp28-related outer membrane protein [Paludibacteraceae bacterium]